MPPKKNLAQPPVTSATAATANTATHTAAAVAAAAASARLLDISKKLDLLLSSPNSNILDGAEPAKLCRHLSQLFPSFTKQAPFGQQQKQLAGRALSELKLPHLLAKLLAASNIQPVGQLAFSKWQHTGYVRAVVGLLVVHENLFRYLGNLDRETPG